MKKTLRPYQQEVLDCLKKRLKETTGPLLVNASVGSGKSLIIAELLLWLEKANWSALCLTLNSTLIDQNAHTYNLQGGNASIYCAGLKSKCSKNLIVFASPHSICNGIKNAQEICWKPFQLIVLDEAHNLSHHDNSSMYMRIINHYALLSQQNNYSFRVIGLTGTPYRNKGESIVGKDKFFKEQVCEISASWLIENNYLSKPTFGLPKTKSIDFSECTINTMGNFNKKDLEKAINKDERLTAKIIKEIIQIKESGYYGVFIFASTTAHCQECAKALPEGSWAIITAETPHNKRKEYLQRAKDGEISYLITVNCLSVGVDIPAFDICAWLRPTESLILYIQGIGRVLRLHPGKSSALILDYAGNLERHGDIDNPIINQALAKTKETEKEYIFKCYECGEMNTIHARRCIGVTNNKRCEHFFTFKECQNCSTKNDATSRQCRSCNHELIDPNKKLTLKKERKIEVVVRVQEASYNVVQYTNESIMFHALYEILMPSNNIKVINESYLIYDSKKSKSYFYYNFIKKHTDTPSAWYNILCNADELKQNIHKIKIPTYICLQYYAKEWRIKDKMFQESIFM